MQIYKDNYTCADENSCLSLALYSVVGGRPNQQDSAGYELKNKEGIVTVCDGMGGHEGGKIASTIAVNTMLEDFEEYYPSRDLPYMLRKAAERSDLQISSLRKDDGSLMRGGSTVVAIAIRENKLYWLSVGDSRIYLFRNSELTQITEDHVYQSKLDKDLTAGLISKDEYVRKSNSEGESLISFLGIGDLALIGSNDSPLLLQSGDRILLATDGLFKLVPKADMNSILNNFSNIGDALQAMESKAQKYEKKRGLIRDNMTVALIQMK